jgi:hypothetical protein
VVEEGPGKEERHFVSAVELGLIGASASFPSKSSPPSSSSSEAECKSKSSLAELNDMSDWDALGLGYRAHQNTQEGG